MEKDSTLPENQDELMTDLIVNIADYTTQDSVKEAVVYWTDIARRLQQAKFPLFPGISLGEGFDEDLRNDARRLDRFLDRLITTGALETEQLYLKLRVLIAEGDTYEEFQKRMHDLDYSLKCNAIWDHFSVAYRCMTCALNPCMSLCSECFLRNGHEGHDFTRFFSREGGACDCGNADVLDPNGFCSRHGEHAVRPEVSESNRIYLAKYVMMKLFVHLFVSFRGFNERLEHLRVTMDGLILEATVVEKEIEDHTHLIKFIQELVNYGGPMREAMAEILIDRQLYRALTEKTLEHELETPSEERIPDVSLDYRTKKSFENDVNSMIKGDIVRHFKLLQDPEVVKCTNLLQELIFWVFRLGFPHTLCNISLSMLSEPAYLDELSVRFFQWYPLIANLMKNLCAIENDDPNLRGVFVQNTGNRVIHVSVQMLSSAVLCDKLNESVNLIETILGTAKYILSEHVELTTLSLDQNWTFFRLPDVIDMPREWDVIRVEDNAVFAQLGYWFVMGDMQNLLCHPKIALATIKNEKVFRDIYVELVGLMQGMVVQWRIITGDHAENDIYNSRTYTMEYEALSITMFHMICAVRDKQDVVAAVMFFDYILAALQSWVHAIGFSPGTSARMTPRYNVSFHIPLHRQLSSSISHFYFLPQFKEHIESFLEDEELLRVLLLHPVRIHVVRAENAAGMWVRNGQQVRIQCMLYAQSHINMAFYTPDLDLIRIAACHVNKEYFIDTLLMNFNLHEVISLLPLTPREQRIRPPGQPLSNENSNNVSEEEDEHSSGLESDNNEDEASTSEDEDRIASIVVKDFRIVRTTDPPQTQRHQETGQGDVPLLPEEQQQQDEQEDQHQTEDEPMEQEGQQQEQGDQETEVVQQHVEVTIINHSDNVNRYLQPLEASRVRPRIDPSVSTRQSTERDADEEIGVFRLSTNNSILTHLIDVKNKDSNLLRKVLLTLDEHSKLNDNAPDAVFAASRDKRVNNRIPVLGIYWNNACRWFTRKEWVDPVLNGMLRLIAELVVVRINCGMSAEEVLRMEMLHELAHEPCSFSRLRSTVSEKGNRGIPDLDKRFEAILNDIADYKEPDSGAFGELNQGVYGLKRDVWLKEFCPVNCQMFALLRKYTAQTLRRVEDIDKELMPQELRDAGVIPWTPYRLISFDDSLRHEYVRNVGRILLSDHFMQLALTVIIGYTESDMVLEGSYQLVIYLLTLAVQYANTLPRTRRALLFAKFYDRYQVHTSSDPLHNDAAFSVFTTVFHTLIVEAKKQNRLKSVLEKLVTEELCQERIFGGTCEYIGRFISLFSHSEITARVMIAATLRECEEAEEKKSKEEEEKRKLPEEDKKLAAKKRREVLLAMAQKKNSEIMKKMMEREGMTNLDHPAGPTEVQISEKLYDCAICGANEVPSTLDDPFGIVVKVSTNYYLQSFVDYSSNIPSLMEVDVSTGWTGKTRRAFKYPRKEMTCFAVHPYVIDGKFYNTDIVTCGHYLHMRCFNQYRQSIQEADTLMANNVPIRRIIHCPNCRFVVNEILPISIELPPPVVRQGPFTDNKQILNVLCEAVMTWKGRIADVERNIQYINQYTNSYSPVIKRANAGDKDVDQNFEMLVTRQTLFASLTRSLIEQSVGLQELNLPERRKNYRNLITKSFMPSMAASTTSLDLELVVCALRDLFIGRVLPTSAKSSPRMEVRRFDRPDAGRDEQALEDLIDMNILKSTSEEEKEQTAKTRDWLQSCNYKEELEVHESPIPLIHFDFALLTVRIFAYVMDSHMLTAEEKKALCSILYFKLVTAYTVRVSILAAQRVSRATIMSIIRGTAFQKPSAITSMMRTVVTELSKDESQFAGMMSYLSTTETDAISPEECSVLLENSLERYGKFVVMLLNYTNIDKPENYMTIDDLPKALDDRLFDSIAPEQSVLQYWIATAYPLIAFNYMTKQKTLCSEPMAWKMFIIMELPQKYDEIFTSYFKQECINCSQVPTNPLICLFCGKLVCLDDCCKTGELGTTVFEVESHSQSCSSGITAYLAINNAVIVIYNKGQTCIWGSLYLDKHGEEDRNLRRGKPLFLSQKRVDTLRRDWVEQDWTTTKQMQWGSVSNLWMTLRDTHLWLSR